MHVGSPRALPVMLLVAAALACQHPSRTETPTPAFRDAVAGTDWELVELAGQPAPTGAGGRRATIRFEADTARAGGFAGCNRYGGSCTVAGETLRFGALAMTKMACVQGMDLERRVAEALSATQRYELAGNRLTFYGASGPVARFARAAP